ncbi:MAG TPA: iron-containing alcohol dehydrogenase [Acidobacteriaceae bacterium]|nr:iron-containing alcohol dehydrogenase [Acidobacteriaceae bacterium]
MTTEIQIPSILQIGGGAFSEVPAILPRLNCAHPLIVTDNFLVRQGLAGRLRDQILQSGRSAEVFSETVPDPTTEAVEAGVRAFHSGKHDSLISLGGGSPIDTAKAIGMLVANSGQARDYKVPNPIPKTGPPHIAIPTTAGTGSEVSRFTVISDSVHGEKMLIAGSALLPSAAVVDYELTLSMPQRLTADTGTDSLTHALEAYVSRKANRFTDTFALAAMKTIWAELPVAFREPGNRAAREAMMLAATMAGIAFSNASVALVHGMSRPIGVFFHVPHGLSNAMLLPSVTAFSASASARRYAECARAMGIAEERDSPETAADKLVNALFHRNQELEVPSPKQFGISEASYFEAIPTMAAQALVSGSPQNNPRVPTGAEIEELYRQLWTA